MAEAACAQLCEGSNICPTILLQAGFEELGNGNMSSEMDLKQAEWGEGGWKKIFHYFIAPF